MVDQVTKVYNIHVQDTGLAEILHELVDLDGATKKVDGTTTTYSKHVRELDRNIKGTAQTTSNSTKAFSKMQQGMQGLVPLYASIASNVFALSAAFRAFSSAANFDTMVQSAEEFGVRTGRSILSTAKHVRDLSAGTLDLRNAITQVSKASLTGIDNSRIIELTQVARNASTALGISMDEALQRIFDSITKMNPELLDSVGLFTRLDTALKDYAIEVKKNAKDLTEAERRTAMYNAVMRVAKDRFMDLSDAVNLNPYSKLASTFSDVSVSILNLSNKVMKPFVDFFSSNMSALTALTIVFGASVIQKTIPLMEKFGAQVGKSLESAVQEASVKYGELEASKKWYADQVEIQSNRVVKAQEKEIQATRELLDAIVQAKADFGMRQGKEAHLAIVPDAKMMRDGTALINKYINDTTSGYHRLLRQSDELLNAHNRLIAVQRELAAATTAANSKIISGFANAQLSVRAFVKETTAAAAAVASAAWVGGITAAQAAWSGGLRTLWTDIRNTESQLNHLIGTTSLFTRNIVYATKGVVGLTTYLARMIPKAAGVWIALQATLAIIQPLTDFLGITSKNSRELSSSIDSLEKEMDGISKKTKFYNDNLKNLPNTIDNVDRKLSHQINTLNDLSSALESVIDKLDSGGFSGWDIFQDEFLFGGSIESLRKQLNRAMDSLIDQDSKGAIKRLFESVGAAGIDDLNFNNLEKLAKVLRDIKNEALEASNRARDFNTAIRDTFDDFSKDFSLLGGTLPELNAAQKSLGRLEAVMSTFENIGSDLSRPMEMIQRLSDSSLYMLGISREEIDKTVEASKKRADLENTYRNSVATVNNLLSFRNSQNAAQIDAGVKAWKQQGDAAKEALDEIDDYEQGIIQAFDKARTYLRELQIAQEKFATQSLEVQILSDFGVAKGQSTDKYVDKLSEAQIEYNAVLLRTNQINRQRISDELELEKAKEYEFRDLKKINDLINQQTALELQAQEISEKSLQNKTANINNTLTSLQGLNSLYLDNTISLSQYEDMTRKYEARLLEILKTLKLSQDAEKILAEIRNANATDLAKSLTDLYKTNVSTVNAEAGSGLTDYVSKLEILTKLAENASEEQLPEIVKAMQANALAYHKSANSISYLIKEKEKDLAISKRLIGASDKIRSVEEALDEIRRQREESMPVGAKIFEEGQEEQLRTLLGLIWDLQNATKSFAEEMEYFGQNMSSAFGSLRTMTKEGSRDYANLTKAMEAMNIVAGVGAVLHQLNNGDVYSAIPRAAAVAAAVAGLGVQIASFAGSLHGSSSKWQENQARQGTGSVLGMSEEKSTSLVNAAEITANATEALLGVSTKMLAALENVLQNITGAGTLMARRNSVGGAFSGGLPDIPLVGQLLPNFIAPILAPFDLLFGGAISKIGSSLLGFSKTEERDRGIRIIGNSFAEMMEGVTADIFRDLSKKKLFKRKNWTEYTALDDEITNQFTLIFRSMGDAVVEASSLLGLSVAEINRRLESFILDTTSISLKNLSGEGQIKAMEDVFSNIFDDLAAYVVPWASEFQKVGEGLGETLLRLAQNVSFTNVSLDRLNKSFNNLSSKEITTLSTILIEAAGGFEDLSSSMNDFITGFYSEAEQLEVQQADLTRVLEELGYSALPEARAGFREMIDAIQVTDEASAKLLASMLSITGAADRFYTALEKAAKEADDAAKKILDGFKNLDQMILSHILDPFSFAFVELTNAEEERLALAQEIGYDMIRLEYLNLLERKKMVEEFASEYINALNSVNEFVNSMKFDTLSPLSYSEQLNIAEAIYQETLEKARSGETTAIEQLPEVARTLLEMTQSFFGGTAGYKDTFSSIMSELSDIVVNQRDPLVEEMERNSRQSIENTTRIVDALTNINNNIVQLVDQNAELQEWINLQKSGLTV